jgi:hypothetical protein
MQETTFQMPSECKICSADPSFEETVANAAILRLHTAVLWAEVSSPLS